MSTLHGINPTSVIEAIKNRSSRWRAGNREDDGRKLGLVIEGGAMRAVCSAGGAMALSHLGFSELFDEVYATSAGVMNASYFLSDQPDLGISIYFENCTTRAFLNPLRVWKILDIDYLFDIIANVKKLDVDRILASRTKLFVSVIDKNTGAADVIDAKATGKSFLSVLKAATAIPVLYNRSIDIEGRPLMDAGLALPFPIKAAIDNSCTDILTLLTRPASFTASPPSWASRQMFNLFCARGNSGLNSTYGLLHKNYQFALDLALGRCEVSGVNIATVCPDEKEVIQRTTTDEALLRQAAINYGRQVLEAFGADTANWTIE